MSTYAAQTSVSVEKSQAELQRVLTRWGADQYAFGWEAARAVVGFRAQNRNVRFVLELPSIDDYARTPKQRYLRDPETQQKAWEQACRQQWRSLVLTVKAKLEAVESGIATFEDEFLPYTLLPSGETVAEWVGPQIDQAIETGAMPDSLPGMARALPPAT